LASVDELLELVHWPHASGCVLVVGHQPTLGQTISRLLGMNDQDCSVKKGAVWWLRLRERQPPERTTLVAVLSPDLV
jgi:phosphohistidine phosphatase